MADTSIDPKTVEAMKIFRMETDKVNDKFKKLEQHMSKFSRDINMANVRTVDFAKSWKAMSKIDAFADANKSLSQMNQGMKEFHAVRKKGGEARPAPAPTETAQPEQGSKVEIGTLRIDVSGVTDKTDKEKLARDISQRVTRTLKTQTGGPVSSGGYNRGL
jgi:hypothetical protein